MYLVEVLEELRSVEHRGVGELRVENQVLGQRGELLQRCNAFHHAIRLEAGLEWTVEEETDDRPIVLRLFSWTLSFWHTVKGQRKSS